jgi:hypothetical protein
MTSLDHYNTLIAEGPGGYEGTTGFLAGQLPDLWVFEYLTACAHQPNVLQISIEGFEHLFDFTSDPALSQEDAPEDRLIAVFGLSKEPTNGRDSSRMRGFLGPGLVGADSEPRDKGHFIAHSAGGGLDINLFPQRPELNRGYSTEGKVFRRMERYAAKHPGTFVFARPIYADQSWIPAELEYGVLLRNLRLWVERLGN